MSNRTELLTPVGRLVQGSLYEPQTTDAENRPLVYKSGPNAGQNRVEFYFAIAIPKGGEQHWAQTVWGAKIYAVGQAGFPNGQFNSPTFAWKIKDGDSAIPNRAGRKPCDCEGFPGHWVLSFSSGFAPQILNADGTQQILEPNAINLGDYIQVFGSVNDNESQQQPGVFLNHSMVALAGYGKRIFVGADPKSVGFGAGVSLPAGASLTPVAQGFNPAPTQAATPHSLPPMPANAAPMPASAAPLPTAPAPHYGILNPPAPAVPAPAPALAPVAPVRTMTAQANGLTYEQYKASGWSDEQLIQHGYMLP